MAGEKSQKDQRCWYKITSKGNVLKERNFRHEDGRVCLFFQTPSESDDKTVKESSVISETLSDETIMDMSQEGNEQMEVDQTNTDTAPTKSKKRVLWVADELLVAIQYFEIDESERGGCGLCIIIVCVYLLLLFTIL